MTKLQNFIELDGVILFTTVIFEKGDYDTNCPDSFELKSAYIQDTDVTNLLSESQYRIIEENVASIYYEYSTAPVNKKPSILQKLTALQNEAKPILNNLFLFGNLSNDEKIKLDSINKQIFETIENI